MKSFYVGVVLIGLLFLSVPVYAITSDTAYQAGFALYNQGQWQEAIDEEKEAIRLDPQNWQAYQILGYAYYRIDKNELALDAFEQSLSINPDNGPLEDFVNTVKAANNVKQNTYQALASVAPPINNVTQSHSNKSLFIAFGAGFPLAPNDFTSDRNVAYSGGLGLNIGISSVTSFVLDAHYNDFSLNTTPYTIAGDTVTGGDLANLVVLANIKANFNDDMPVSPYFIAGFGVSELWKSQLNVASGNVILIVLPQAQTDFAFRLGFGIDIKLDNGNALFLETNGIGAIVNNTLLGTSETELYDMTNLGINFDL